MAVWSFNNSAFVADGAGVSMTLSDVAFLFDWPLISTSSTRIRLYESGSSYIDFLGNGFTFVSSGGDVSVTGGTLTGIRNFAEGTQWFSTTGLSLSAVTFDSYIDAENWLGARNFLLSGADTVNGTSLGDILYAGGNNDVINGNGGADRLFGESGADRLYGGAGNDTASGGVGNDRIWGGTGNDRLLGEGGNDRLFGEAGNDVLIGGAGNDTLAGGGGRDTLTGGAGADHFLFNTAPAAPGNVDRITDFNVAGDTIDIDNAVFTAIGADGPLLAGRFVIGGSALDSNDRIIYRQSTGNIYYDADGNGGGAQILFAQVTAGTALTAADFLIV